MKQTLLFIRHGQTTWNVEQRLPGQLPGIHLTDTGKKQAERLADALAVLPISAVISSPLERARETAEIIAQPRQLAIQFEADLMDIDVGHWAGQDHDELNKNDEAWKAFKKNPTVAPPDVETFPQVQARAVAAVERWRSQETSGAYPACLKNSVQLAAIVFWVDVCAVDWVAAAAGLPDDDALAEADELPAADELAADELDELEATNLVHVHAHRHRDHVHTHRHGLDHHETECEHR